MSARSCASRWALIGMACLAMTTGAIAQEQPAETATLTGDQTLEDLAKKLFDDPRAAAEIRAINGLVPGAQPKPGESFKLPGAQRQPAITALGVATQAVRDAKLQGAAEYAAEKYKKTDASLKHSQQACAKADYSACQRLADETWALARLARKESRKRQSSRNRFAVSVDERGATRVEVMEGDGVEVSAQKKRTVVRRDQAVRVLPGKAPGKPRKLLAPPKPVLPFPGSKLVTTSIHFAWNPVEDATRYVLLISRDSAGRMPVRQMTTEGTSYLFRSSLKDGEYYWFLRTVDAQGLVGRASAARAFILSATPGGGLTVEGGGTAPSPKGR